LLGAKHEAETIPVEKAAEIKKQLLVLPIAEQLPRWKEHAKSPSLYLRQEAIKHIAWAKDPEGVAIATNALSDIDQAVRGQAATALLEYGSPAADSAKPALMKALTEAKPESKPQIVWALAELGEKSATKIILEEYRAGRLAQVQTLDKASVFDPNKLVALVGVDELATMAKDPSPAVRQLVATVLSRHAEVNTPIRPSLPRPSGNLPPGSASPAKSATRGAPAASQLKGPDSDSRTIPGSVARRRRAESRGLARQHPSDDKAAAIQ
jgi:HEAT repeat protein